MKLTLRTWPDLILSKKTLPVVEFDEMRLNQIITDMFLVMKKNDGVGLAANQVGLSERIFIYRVGNEEGYMINPKIVNKSEDIQIMHEGCLSFPGVRVLVERAKSITVEYQDTEQNIHKRTFVDFPAQCIQHEIEHLDGITFISHLSGLKRDLVTRKMKKRKRQYEKAEKWIGTQGSSRPNI